MVLQENTTAKPNKAGVNNMGEQEYQPNGDESDRTVPWSQH